jgi:hypothetical protein
MKIIIKMLISYSSVLSGFASTNSDVTTQYHADEKRNVKQPPLLEITLNFTQKVFNAISPPVPCHKI